jgi:hypothetical protein
MYCRITAAPRLGHLETALELGLENQMGGHRGGTIVGTGEDEDVCRPHRAKHGRHQRSMIRRRGTMPQWGVLHYAEVAAEGF